jgi:peptidoglycan/xylan/chitin deacetylase (PgdA/CDA1 family)
MAVRSGFASGRLRSGHPTAAILAYHNVLPDDAPPVGDVALHIGRRRFAAHLDRLVETHRVVPLHELHTAEDDGRPLAVLTFDDAYRGALTVGLDEVAARGLPATVFVTPGHLGGEGFWWDLLAPGGGEPLADEVRTRALWSHDGNHEQVLAWAHDANVPRSALPPEARPADVSLLRQAARRPGVTLGSHTWGHVNLGALSADACHAEVERGHRGLADAVGAGATLIDWLAYPYGLHSPAAVEAAGRTVSGAVLVEGGLARWQGRWSPEPLRVPRISVPRGLSVDGLSLRLAGLLDGAPPAAPPDDGRAG